MELTGRRVEFVVRDIYYPPYESVLGDVHGHDVMNGEVVDVTEAGGERATFAVVKVDALSYPVVVPVDRLRD